MYLSVYLIRLTWTNISQFTHYLHNVCYYAFSYCYHSVLVVSLSRSQSDHIKGLFLHSQSAILFVSLACFDMFAVIYSSGNYVLNFLAFVVMKVFLNIFDFAEPFRPLKKFAEPLPQIINVCGTPLVSQFTHYRHNLCFNAFSYCYNSVIVVIFYIFISFCACFLEMFAVIYSKFYGDCFMKCLL